MARREFAAVVSSGLLRDVERIVVEAHRRLYEREGREWSQPLAYTWLRYEDPAPTVRLLEGVRRLRREGSEFDSAAVEKACEKASRSGFLN